MLSSLVLNNTHTPFIRAEQRDALGCIVLNRQAALNATNMEMVGAINNALTIFSSTPEILHIAILSNCERAFCAGGDIRAAYYAIQKNDFHLCESYFRAEYDLTNRLATFPKPIYAFINGLTLGGGMGISIHCHARIAGENAIFGMPETTIGFFPDVGAAYFYNHLNNTNATNAEGMYLALTGAKFGRDQAIQNGIATHAIDTSEWESLLKQLASGKMLDTCIYNKAETKPYRQNTVIDSAFNKTTLPAIIETLPEDIRCDLLKKSPLSVYVTYFYMKHAQNLSLKEIIAHDLKLAMHFVQHGEFMEGIRALIIDKDKTPKWRYTWDEIASMNPDNQPFEAFLNQLFATNHKSLGSHTD
jgi:enoyl-CoA hydratase